VIRCWGFQKIRGVIERSYIAKTADYCCSSMWGLFQMGLSKWRGKACKASVTIKMEAAGGQLARS